MTNKQESTKKERCFDKSTEQAYLIVEMPVTAGNNGSMKNCGRERKRSLVGWLGFMAYQPL